MKKLNKTELELISRNIYNELKEQALLNITDKAKELSQNPDVKKLISLNKKLAPLQEQISTCREKINKQFKVSMYYDFTTKYLAEQVLTQNINLGKIESSLILGQIDSKDLDTLIQNVKEKFKA
jgi:hypothetical protein